MMLRNRLHPAARGRLYDCPLGNHGPPLSDAEMGRTLWHCLIRFVGIPFDLGKLWTFCANNKLDLPTTLNELCTYCHDTSLRVH
jgi:hypothetical protein